MSITRFNKQLFMIYDWFLKTAKRIQTARGNTREEYKSSHRRCSFKKGVLKISQNSQENTCARVSFNKVAGLRSAKLFKKRLWHRCFPVNFAEFFRIPFFAEHLWWLLLGIKLRWPKFS